MTEARNRSGRQEPTPEDREQRAARKAVSLILQHDLRRGTRQIEGKGTHDPWEEGVRQQLLDKHPPAQSPRWASDLTDNLPPAAIDQETLLKYARRMDVKSGAGTDGRRAHTLQCLASYNFRNPIADDDPESDEDPLLGPPSHAKALRMTALVWGAVFDQRFPSWIVDHLVRTI